MGLWRWGTSAITKMMTKNNRNMSVFLLTDARLIFNDFVLVSDFFCLFLWCFGRLLACFGL